MIESIEGLIIVLESRLEIVLIEVEMIIVLHVLHLPEVDEGMMIIVVDEIEVGIGLIGGVDRDHHIVAATDIPVAVHRHVGAQRRKPTCYYQSVNLEMYRKYNFYYLMNWIGKTILDSSVFYTLIGRWFNCLLQYRNFINYVDKIFRDRGIRTDVLFLDPRLSLAVVIKRQIVEGVHAIVKLTRQSQMSGRIPLQVFDRTAGTDTVRFDGMILIPKGSNVSYANSMFKSMTI